MGFKVGLKVKSVYSTLSSSAVCACQAVGLWGLGMGVGWMLARSERGDEVHRALDPKESCFVVRLSWKVGTYKL